MKEVLAKVQGLYAREQILPSFYQHIWWRNNTTRGGTDKTAKNIFNEIVFLWCLSNLIMVSIICVENVLEKNCRKCPIGGAEVAILKRLVGLALL